MTYVTPIKNGVKPIQLSNEWTDLITVIVLSYGPSDQYEHTLRSVLEQDYPRIELIVSDDASDTFDREAVWEFLKQYGRTNLQAVEVRKNETNQGIPRHNNTAARLAHGTYIKFVADGDRFLAADSLRKLWEFARLQEADVVASPSLVTNEEHTRDFYLFPSCRRIKKLNTSGDLFSLLAKANLFSAVGMLYRPAFFQRGGFDENYRYLEDWPAWLKIARVGGRIPCCEAPAMRYALSGVSNGAGSAFDAPALRDDMLRCYETEIFPYRSQLSRSAVHRAEYQFGRLCGRRPRPDELWFEWMRLGKRTIKKLFFR